MFPGISEPSRLTETKDRALNVTPEILTQQAKDPRIFCHNFQELVHKLSRAGPKSSTA